MYSRRPGRLAIYLAGKVPKGADIGSVSDWRSEYIRSLEHTGRFDILSPEDPYLDESQPLTVFGHDCMLISDADIVVIEASDKLGVGTAQEMLIAKYFRKPVLTVLPKRTHHRRENLWMHGIVVADWIHPFIAATSDRIYAARNDLFQDLETHATWAWLEEPSGLEIIPDAISIYKHSLQRQRTGDDPEPSKGMSP